MNNTNRYSDLAHKIARRYHKLPNLKGILWTGSSVYGIDDTYVDLDLQLLFAEFKTDLHMDQFKEDGVKIEVSPMALSWLLDPNSTSPDSEQYWIRGSSAIMFDANGTLPDFFKTANSITEKKWAQLEWELFKQLFNSYEYHKAAARGDAITASMYVSRTVEILSRFIFVSNRRAVPTYKWRWYFIQRDHLFRTENINNLLINNASKDLDSRFQLLEDVENIARQMMIKKGIPEQMIAEPWKFNHPL